MGAGVILETPVVFKQGGTLKTHGFGDLSIALAQRAKLNLKTQLTPTKHPHHDDDEYHTSTTLPSDKVNRVNWINWVQLGSTGTAHLLAPLRCCFFLHFSSPF